MRRAQIQLDEETYEALRRRSYEERRSIAAIVRELVARSVGTAGSSRRHLGLADFPFIGAGRSEQGKLSPVSERHDEALAEAMTRKRRRR